MRREERVTVQGPVKEQQPDGMSHRGGDSVGRKFGAGILAFQCGRQISHAKSRGFLPGPPIPLCFACSMPHSLSLLPPIFPQPNLSTPNWTPPPPPALRTRPGHCHGRCPGHRPCPSAGPCLVRIRGGMSRYGEEGCRRSDNGAIPCCVCNATASARVLVSHVQRGSGVHFGRWESARRQQSSLGAFAPVAVRQPVAL